MTSTNYYEEWNLFHDEEQSLALDVLSNCCNNTWPSSAQTYPNSPTCAFMNLCEEDPPEYLSCLECALLWSEYNYDESVDLFFLACDESTPYLPRTPSWISGSISGDNPKLDWGFVYTHKTLIQRKIGNGSWVDLNTVNILLTDSGALGDSSYTDNSVDLDEITVNHYYRVKSLIYTSSSTPSETIKYEEPLVVNISGPTSLTTLQTGTFVANVVGGLPSYTYEWWKYQDCNDPKQNDGETRAPSCGSWVKLSETSNTLVKGGVEPGFQLKVTVMDQESESDTDYHYVTVSTP